MWWKYNKIKRIKGKEQLKVKIEKFSSKLGGVVVGIYAITQQSIKNESNYVTFIHRNKNKQKPFIIGLHDKTSPKIKLNMG